MRPGRQEETGQFLETDKETDNETGKCVGLLLGFLMAQARPETSPPAADCHNNSKPNGKRREPFTRRPPQAFAVFLFCSLRLE